MVGVVRRVIHGVQCNQFVCFGQPHLTFLPNFRHIQKVKRRKPMNDLFALFILSPKQLTFTLKITLCYSDLDEKRSMIRLIVSEVCKSYQLHVNYVGRGATRAGFFSSFTLKVYNDFSNQFNKEKNLKEMRVIPATHPLLAPQKIHPLPCHAQHG
ncbi:hypothetical protein Hanom_Chr04g00339911 [Helianthus anomalus]